MELIPLLSTAALVLDFVFVFAILFLERGDPTRTLIWIMVLLLLPLAGAPLYVFLHQNHRRQKKKFARKEVIDARLRKLYQEICTPSGWRRTRAGAEVLKEYGSLAQMVSREDPDSKVIPGNKVNLFYEGEDMFGSMKKDLAGARHHIHFQYYQVRNDALGRDILGILAARAKEGIEVRVLLDAWGSRRLKSLVSLIRENGGLVEFFYPGIYHYNYRNHRKIVVVDGGIGYCGGFNVGEEYLGKGPLGHWRDSAARITGPEVYELQLRFIQDWNYSSPNQVPFDQEYFPEPVHVGQSLVQEVSSGPDTSQERIKQTYLRMISLARNSCYIQTPYFIPDGSLQETLAIAAASGVDVRIMIPDKPDHVFVYWASLSFCADLLEAGVRIYNYNQGFLHSKTIVVDGTVGSVGSANFDIRSFRLNFETNVIIYDPEVVSDMKEAFLRDLRVCTELDMKRYDERGLAVRIKEPFARLLFPLV